MNELSAYGDAIAQIYDDWVTARLGPLPAAMIDRLEELSGSGRALELGIGTGRVALPLAERGIDVQGIDSSSAMVAKMRAKPGGDRIGVEMGNFRDVPSEGRFSLVFVVYNTFFALLSQEDQVACFSAVSDHLEPGGRFVIEAFVPDVTRFDRGQRLATLAVGDDWVETEAAVFDRASQRVDAGLTRTGPQRDYFIPVSIRFAYPPELDLMARLAGLTLEERWGDWDRSAFSSSSDKHVSVYRSAPR